AYIHKNRLTGAANLFTSHNIEVNSSGVANSSGNRDGVRWYEIGNLATAPSLVQSGTLFDSAASNPLNYWIPSTMVSGQGHMAIGCSVAGATKRCEVAVAGRLSSDALGTTQAATIAQSSSTNYNAGGGNPQRWGDYSSTFVDPQDDMTMWTFQEYCNATNSWAVHVRKLIAPPPASPTSTSPSSMTQGQSNLNVVVTGTSASGSGFFDPDGTFPNHISASVSGTGVTVNSITFTDPTHVTLNLTATAGATLGNRNITITNPDGQSLTGTAIFSVTPVAVPTGACCNGGSCTVVTASACASGGGTYQGDGMACGSCPPVCAADISPVGSPDGQVNIDDLTQIILNWGTNNANADINDDGIVNIDDLTAVILAWGPC
ncbi:MAG TPA: GC-type dockerin domain-anchored protein, partial [Phycisphaerales bacterium]|nr:GC-type dockerin domain-anchored protein [Phycisphaerales bacterium]